MKIRFNGQELELFSGARVKDALLKYSETDYKAVLNGEKQVRDKWNNEIEPDGELTENQKLFLRGNP